MSSDATTVRRPPAEPLRVLFFGPPFSGKSDLMRAFGDIASAGAEEEPVELAVGPQPADATGREVIRRMVSVDLPDVGGSARSVTLIDCDGQAAGRLLLDATVLGRARVKDELAVALRTADAVVVTVDATAGDDAVAALFANLQPFLDLLQRGRTAGREIGGLPVFLALTKSDRLYEPGDRPTEWISKAEKRQKRVEGLYGERFEPGGEDGDDFHPFGKVELKPEVLPTARQVPAVDGFGIYADANGAFNVNRLLRKVLAAAGEYRARLLRGKRRLTWTVSAALGLLGLMLSAFAVLALTGEPGPVEALTLRVRQAQEQEGPPETRLAERNLPRNRKRLDDFRATPHFAELPPDLRAWAADRDREFAAYEEYRKRFQPPQFSPAEVRTTSDLTKVTADLVNVLAPPVDYAKAWAKTEAVLLRDKWAADRDLLVKAEGETHDWYRSLVTRASKLLAVDVPGAAWREDATGLLAVARTPPVTATDPIPGSPAVPVRRGQPLTYAAAFDFERTDLARQDWEFVGRKVGDLRDLTDALGLTVDPAAPGAPLDLPEPTGDAAASLTLGADRWRAVRDRFPRAVGGTANWAASYFPDPVRQELARRSRTAAETALRHVRRLIVAELKATGRVDAPADWPKLADGLLAAPEMQDWSRLVQLLMKCADLDRPTAAPPVAVLAAFVRKTSFEWSPTAVELFLPTALLTAAYAPDGTFAVTVTPAQGTPRVTAFGPAAVSERTPRGVLYRFPLERGTAPLVYRPGETLTADLSVKAGAATYKLQWAAGGTATYQFDRLTREPELEPTAGGVAFPATGVKLTWTPAKEAVTVPELLPSLR